MQDNEKKPALRFKGFTDPWEQRKLAELTKTITTGKSVNSDEGEVSDGDIGVLKTSCVSYDRFNPSESKPVVKSEQQLVKCAVEKDSVIVSRMNTPERVGACGYVSTDFPNLFLPDRLWKLKFQDTVDTYFVYMMLVSSAYKEKITSMASGTSGSMYNIPKETFLNLQLVIPAKIDEQKQLGRILKKIDSLITLHQRKYEKLVNIKKSMLNKMFPQNGASVPEIRFKDFTDPWEQRKLGEIAVEKLSNGVMNHPASNATGVRHINVINMYTPDKIHLEDLTFSSYDGDVIQKCNVEIGDIFLTRSSLKPEGIAEANVLLDDGRFIYDDHLIRLKINKNEYVPLFVKINLGVPFIKVQFISKSKTTAFTTIGQDDISECVGLFPEKEEQQKIAIFFHNLNTLITLHQRKLEKLQNIKKSCLEKMFA